MPKAKTPTRDYHPAKVQRSTAATASKGKVSSIVIPKDQVGLEVQVGNKSVKLTNLDKLFWPELGITKRDLTAVLRRCAHVLLPHLADRAMVMKRYPNGAAGEFFFMKRAPAPRPDWIETMLDRARLGERHRLSR